MELWDQFVPKKDARRAARDLSRGSVGVTPPPWRSVTRAPGTCRSAGSCCSATRSGGSTRRGGRTRLTYRTTTRRAIRRAENGGGPAPPVRPGSDRRPDRRPPPVDGRVRRIGRCSSSTTRTCAEFLTWDELDDDHSAREMSGAVRSAGAARVPAGRRDVPGRLDPMGGGPAAGSRSTEATARRPRGWWPGAESNCRHRGFQPRALPTELPGPGPRDPARLTGFDPAISALTGR